MAIQFLNTLNFNQNEAVSFRLDNEPNDPAAPVGGQLYYNNTNGVVKFYDDVNTTWVTLADTLNTGVTSITSGNGGTSTGDPITVNTAATGAISLKVFEYDGDSKVGFVPAGGISTTFLAGDGSWDTPIDTGVTGVTLATGTSTGAPLTESITGRELTLTSMAYNGGANVGFVPSGGAAAKYLEGDGSWGTPTGTYKWNIQADQSGGGSNPEAVGIGGTVDFVGGNIIKTSLDSSGTPFDLTIAHETITTGATGVGPTVINGGDTFDVTTSLTNDGFGHITDVTTTTFELADFIPSGGITAQNGVKDTGSSNAPVIEVDYGANTNNVIASATSGNIGASHWLMASASGNVGPNGAVVNAQVGSIPLNDWAIPDGNVALGANGGTLYNIIDLKDPVDQQDAATKAYVDSVASGALQFKGSFDPATGEIGSTSTYLYQLTGGNFDSSKARVAVEVGDLYIASGTGDFYANSATPLTAGDQVFGQKAALANNSFENDWAVVQSDTDVATYTGIGIGNVNVQKTSAVAAGYHGSANGVATGGAINVDYTNPSNGTANISLREASSSALGIISIKNTDGSINISYSNGEATISTSGNPSGVRLSLGASSGNVTKIAATSTEQTWEIDCNAELGTTANNVTCQVIQESDGSTVFPDVTRSGDDMSISFSLLPSAPGNGDYEVLLISVS